jgi:hypothetical protein
MRAAYARGVREVECAGRNPAGLRAVPVSFSFYSLNRALGYEDLDDHEQLCRDPLLGLLSGKRKLQEELAGKSTLNRLELAGRTARYHKISCSAEAVDRLPVDLYLESHRSQPDRSCSIWIPTARSTVTSRSASSTAASAARCLALNTEKACSFVDISAPLQKRLPRRDIGAEGLMRNTLFGVFTIAAISLT